MKKVSVLLFAFLFFVVSGAFAQNYGTAIGAKFYAGNGSLGGINVRHNMKVNSALEGSLLFYSGGLGLEGLYEYQGPINGAAGLNYFVGGGGVLGFGTNKNSGTSFSLRLTGGLDYKFADAPINVSFGLDPFFAIAPSTGSSLAVGIGLRYTLN